MKYQGERWRRMKSILSPAFTSSKMKGMFPFISKCGQQLVNHLESLLQESDDVLELEMKDLFTRYTNDVIATSAFGICCDSLKNPNNEFYLCGKDITSFSLLTFLSMIGYMLFPKLMALMKIKFISTKSANFLYNAVRETIRTREERGIIRPDMIHLLMQARKEELLNDGSNDKVNGETNEKENVKFGLTETDITAQAMIFFFEGFEMPATVLSFASILLAMHQDIQERLQEEIDQTLVDCDGSITYDALHNMKYLDMVISETLRMYPPEIMTERQCTKPYVIPATKNTPAVKLAVKDRIFIPIYAVHHDPLYYPDPEKFNPERFSETNKRNIRPYTYLPFGSGPRSCIGTRFALMENKIALAYLLSKFTLQIIDKSPVPIKFRINSYQLAPDKGFWIGLRLRKFTE